MKPTREEKKAAYRETIERFLRRAKEPSIDAAVKEAEDYLFILSAEAYDYELLHEAKDEIIEEIRDKVEILRPVE